MILNDEKGKLIIFLVIILVVSITPASAIQIGQSTGNGSALWLSDLLNKEKGKQ